MARPIPLTAPTHEPRQDFVDKLESAPDDHAEALLDGYELVQQLHASGVFSVLRGALAAGDKLMNAATGAINSPEVIAGLCNVIVLGKALAAVDPHVMRSFAKAVDDTMSESTRAAEPPSLMTLLGHFRQPEVRRGIALVNRFLAALGRAASEARAQQKDAGRAA